VPQIAIHYYAAARELAGTDCEQLVVAQAPLSCAALLVVLGQRHPRLAPHLPRMRLAINDALVGADALVCADDEVALLPPVAGGAPDPTRVRDTALSVDEAIAAVRHPAAGGIAVFIGVVRDHADGKPVGRLDYEALRKLAEHDLSSIVADVMGKHEGARVCALHRVGQLAVGDLAVVVAASAAHREQAFAACREAIEEIKRRANIGKKEWAPDGTAHWVNLEG
jgi:molybdopterin synthase catalytic subunit